MGWTGLWIVLGTLLAGTLAGALLRWREGRIRPTRDEPAPTAELPTQVTEVLVAAPAVTLVQISTTFCSPCRHAHARLAALAESTPELHHVDLDVTHQPEVAHQLGVRRTPTTIAFDANGAELLRVSGVPVNDELLSALQPHFANR
ncbi:MAG: thioredoxin [Actinophytocola sp.]|nr:thioredoxin [Actinophytocola sp.]